MNSEPSLKGLSAISCKLTRGRLCSIFGSLILALFGFQLLRTRLTTDKNSFPGKYLTFPSGWLSRGDQNTARKFHSSAINVANEFRPINGSRVFSFFDVCIEELESTSKPKKNWDPVTGEYWDDTRKIVIYNSLNESGAQKMKTIGTPGTSWDIYYSPLRVPPSHTMLETTAFFNYAKYTGNLCHFWNDMFAGLYAVMRETNRLRAGADNRIVYRRPRPAEELNRFEVLLKTLPINANREIFTRVQPNTCFRRAVFGTSWVGKYERREVVNHVMLRLNLTHLQSGGGYVTFIQRTESRLVANLDELVTAAKSLNFTKVRVVCFESLGVVEQVRVASESRIMVGVQGAGLLWAIFMPSGSTLVEIAWPHKHWPHVYWDTITSYGVVLRHVNAVSVQLNWPAYEKQYHNGKRLDDEERGRILMNAPGDGHSQNPWKAASAVVDKYDLLKILVSIKRN